MSGRKKPIAAGMLSLMHAQLSNNAIWIQLECCNHSRLLQEELLGIGADNADEILKLGNLTCILSPVTNWPDVQREIATPVDEFGAWPLNESELRTTSGI